MNNDDPVNNNIPFDHPENIVTPEALEEMRARMPSLIPPEVATGSYGEIIGGFNIRESELLQAAADKHRALADENHKLKMLIAGAASIDNDLRTRIEKLGEMVGVDIKAYLDGVCHPFENPIDQPSSFKWRRP